MIPTRAKPESAAEAEPKACPISLKLARVAGRELRNRANQAKALTITIVATDNTIGMVRVDDRCSVQRMPKLTRGKARDRTGKNGQPVLGGGAGGAGIWCMLSGWGLIDLT